MITKEPKSFMLTGEQIPIARLITLWHGMRLEGKGIKVSKGRSCMSIVKKEFGWRGNREKILMLLADKISEKGAEVNVSNS